MSEAVDFFDPETAECPYPAYQRLRDEAPVWLDPTTGMYVVTRYDDVREVVTDPERFSNDTNKNRRSLRADHVARAERIEKLYLDNGWLPAPTLSRLDDPAHRQLRSLFDDAFRPARIRALEPALAEMAHALIDDFIGAGWCEFVRAFAVPLPLMMICREMGVPAEDIWRIKSWTDAWITKLGLMQSDGEAEATARKEIEAQHYFQPLFDKLRKEPDGTLLSELVNKDVPGWDRKLTDNELHSAMMSDTFVGGSETSTNAFSAGVLLVAQQPDVWARVAADPDRYLDPFVEEVVRLESPIQGLYRRATQDTEIGGVPVPQDAVVNIRFAAANRDERHFDNPDAIDLDRPAPRAHLAFGAGTHYCLGAALARRELHVGFRALIERIGQFRLVEGANDLRHAPSFIVRSLRELHVEFDVR
jgi:cytochrome P450